MWQALERGELRVDGYFHEYARYGLWLSPAVGPSGLSARQSRQLKRFCATRAQKIMSLDDGVTPSAIAGQLRLALRHIGLSCSPSRMPLLVSVAAFAAQGHPMPAGERRSLDGVHQLVTLHSPRAWLSERLSPSETEVALMRIEGLTQQAVAAQRGRSARTIANQAAAVYRRLGVGGRAELLALLAREYSRGAVPRTTPPELEFEAIPPSNGEGPAAQARAV
jgi:DNA-binding CsgD family transcriptional regulator